jgi:alanine-glyoxylate transaminase/serine-glyoxylate transaminase/serine-pyruvate transaminase
MATPMLGYLDPAFLRLLDETQGMLRHVFETANPLTLALTGSGMAGMEAVLANLLEPEDRLLVCAAGFFGERLAEVARRHGAAVTKLERPWGDVFPVEQVEEALARESCKVVSLVHAETSTGALQPLAGLAEAARRHGALLVLDCVTSLGGVRIGLDAHGADAAYSGTQKCLGGPPGLAPVSLSDRAREAVRGRRAPVSAWYFDLELIARYWGGERAYHHTPSPSLLYALHEALRAIAEEGLEARFARHRANAEALWARALRAGRAPPADAHHGQGPGGRRRGRGAGAPARRLRHRDRGGPRAAQGPDLAHRPDGLLLAAGQRRAAARGARARARPLSLASGPH